MSLVYDNHIKFCPADALTFIIDLFIPLLIYDGFLILITYRFFLQKKKERKIQKHIA